MTPVKIQDQILSVLYKHDLEVFTMGRARQVYVDILAIIAPIVADRDEAIELAEEILPYAGEYFIEKWDLDTRVAELKARQ